MCLVWATAFALLYDRITRYRAGSIAIWIGVMSDWFLDWITHGPDMPLYPGGPRFGLGLWNSLAWTLVVELAMFAIGVWLYALATSARDRIGKYGFIAFVAMLLVSYISDLFSAPPVSVSEIAWPRLIASPITLVWAWWFDRHRTARRAPVLSEV